MSHFSMKESLQRSAEKTEKLLQEFYKQSWKTKQNLRNQFKSIDIKNDINQESIIDRSIIEDSICENREFQIKVAIEINEDGKLIIDLDHQEYKYIIIKDKINKSLKIVFTTALT